MKTSVAEKLFVEELSQGARNLKKATGSLSIGELIRLIRTQLGLTQNALASRANVPQSTISRIEKGGRDVSISTLQKILRAMSCDLVIIPCLQENIETMQRRQARTLAQKRVRYLIGTMNLEQQQPDAKFTEELIKEEEKQLMQGPKSKLWEE